MQQGETLLSLGVSYLLFDAVYHASVAQAPLPGHPSAPKLSGAVANLPMLRSSSFCASILTVAGDWMHH